MNPPFIQTLFALQERDFLHVQIADIFLCVLLHLRVAGFPIEPIRQPKTGHSASRYVCEPFDFTFKKPSPNLKRGGTCFEENWWIWRRLFYCRGKYKRHHVPCFCLCDDWNQIIAERYSTYNTEWAIKRLAQKCAGSYSTRHVCYVNVKILLNFFPLRSKLCVRLLTF